MNSRLVTVTYIRATAEAVWAALITPDAIRSYWIEASVQKWNLGPIAPRVIEAPKARLKEIQRWVLREVLDHVPVHPAAHGFAPGRSLIGHANDRSVPIDMESITI